MVLRTVVLGGPVRVGTHAVNVNRRGLWSGRPVRRSCASSPERELAFRVAENHMVWSFSLTPLDGRHPHARRPAPRRRARGSPGSPAPFIGTFLGGQSDFTDDLRAGMRQTLDRLKSEAEAG